MRTSSKKSSYKIVTYVRPGQKWTDARVLEFIRQLRNVAEDCFCEVPNYQALLLSPRALDNKVVSVALNQDEEIVAFCSGLILDVPSVGEVFHTGLTCVGLSARSSGLTHTLMHAAMMKFVLSGNPFRKVWISNVACVLSSLGSVAAFMENVYPSPYGPIKPSAKHSAIADTINKHYRDEIYIDNAATFERNQFVFSGSVEGTVFQKDSDDDRYQHRQALINNYYTQLLNFERGDEVCQVGYIQLSTALKHVLRLKRKVISLTPPEPELVTNNGNKIIDWPLIAKWKSRKLARKKLKQAA